MNVELKRKRQIEHNEELADKLESDDGSRYFDWICVLRFYAALHKVEELIILIKGKNYMSKKYKNSKERKSKHLQRSEVFAECRDDDVRVTDKMVEAYTDLFKRSMWARYSYFRFDGTIIPSTVNAHTKKWLSVIL